MEKIRQIAQHIFTARDGISYSMTKLVGVCASAAMIVQFVRTHSTDFQGFAIGMSAMMAALALKYAVENK